MKKILLAFVGLFMMSACVGEETFKGNTYLLTNAPNDAKITLAFDAEGERFMGRVVNNYFGSYQVAGKSFKFGNAMSTMMAGDPELMEAEHLYLTDLPKVVSYKITSKTLTFVKEDGSELVFEKTGEAKK